MSELQLRFGQFDPTAKQDILSITTSPLKPWNSIDDLKYDAVPEPGNYMTLEHNYGILDGAMGEFPDTPNAPVRTWGFWSENFSDANGNFSSTPALDIRFSANHKSPGITLYFYPHTDDYASSARVTWYNELDAAIKSGVYTMTSNIGAIGEAVENYRRVKIEFLSTNIRHRYIKLFSVNFGVLRIFFDEEINVCDVLEEIDPTVELLSINTLNAEIRTRNSLFSPLLSPEFNNMMMRLQPLTLTKDNEPFGIFFLETWKDPYQSGIVFDIEAVDAMGMFDLYPFNGGIYENVLATDVLNQIFALVFPTNLLSYQIENTLANKRVTGWIPLCTCGEAIQHILFAIHAIADTSRRGYIWIYELDTEVTGNIELIEQYLTGSDEPTEFVSGVDVTSHRYVRNTTEQKEAFNGVLSPGKHRVDFAEPLHTISVTPGTVTIAESTANYVVLNVASQATVLVRAFGYIQNTLLHSVRASLPAGEIQNIKAFSNYTLVSESDGPALAQKLYDWYQNRVKTTVEIKLSNREVGYMYDVKTGMRDLRGIVTSLDINLRADRASMEVVGNALD